MMKFRSLFIVLIVAFSTFSAFAQSNDFVSPDNSFTVSLPNNSASIRVINPYPTVRGGNEFNWRIPQGQFLIGYIDLTLLPKNPKQRLEKAADEIIQGTVNYGGELISKKDISLNNNLGIEVKVFVTKDLISVTRFYLVKNRLYNLSSGWLAKEDGATQLKVLDSFKVLPQKIRNGK